MKKCPKLVDFRYLKKLMRRVEVSDQNLNEYVNAHGSSIELLESRAAKGKCKYLTLCTAIIVSSSLVPAIVSLRELDHLTMPSGFSFRSVVVSVVVGVCAGLESSFGWGISGARSAWPPS